MIFNGLCCNSKLFVSLTGGERCRPLGLLTIFWHRFLLPQCANDTERHQEHSRDRRARGHTGAAGEELGAVHLRPRPHQEGSCAAAVGGLTRMLKQRTVPVTGPGMQSLSHLMCVLTVYRVGADVGFECV